MENQDSNFNISEEKSGNSTSKALRFAQRFAPLAARIVAWALGIFVVIIFAILCIAQWYLVPERATRLANEYANETFDNAQTSIGRVEVHAWSSFPYITIDIADLQIISKAFSQLPENRRAVLPAYADSLVHFSKAHAELNVLQLPFLRFSLHNVSADRLKVNAVQCDSLANYQMSTTSEPSTEPLSLPKIFFNKIALNDCQGITYFSADSISSMAAKLDCKTLALDAQGSDDYMLNFDGNATYQSGELTMLNSEPFTLNGILHWDSDKPMRVALKDMTMQAIDTHLAASLAVDATYTDEIIVESLNLKTAPISYSKLVAALPKEYRNEVASIRTNLTFDFAAALKEPYNLKTDSFPSLEAQLNVPDCYVETVNGKLRLDHMEMAATADLNKDKPELSVAKLSKMLLSAKGMSLNVTGEATDVMRDALIQGDIKGDADLGALIQLLALNFDFSLKGILNANTHLNSRLSSFTNLAYHKIQLDGTATLTDFAYDSPADTMQCSFNKADIVLDSKSQKALRMQAQIDTISASMPGLAVGIKQANASFGVATQHFNPNDTTIVPMGLKIIADRARVQQAGGSKIFMKNPECLATINRYSGLKKNPMIHFDVKVADAGYRDEGLLMVLHGGHFDFFAHLRTAEEKEQAKSKAAARIATLRQENPSLTTEEIFAMARKKAEISSKQEYLDMSVNKGLKDMLVKWNLHGTIQGERGSIFSPYFPVRNRLTGFDMKFSLDSVELNGLRYEAGKSNLRANGVLSNLRPTLLGSKRRPLKLDLTLRTDDMDLDEIINVVTKGMAYSANPTNMPDGEQLTDKQVDALVSKENPADSTLKAIVIPANLDASIKIKGENVHYTNLNFSKLRGSLDMHSGIAAINNLRANTDIGSAQFNAFYAAPNLDEIKVGFDLGMKQIQVAKFIKVIPKIDEYMSLLESVDGVIDANLAATTELDSATNILMPSLKAVMKLSGNNLTFLDAETFRKIGRMLLFKNNNKNSIDHMAMEMIVENQQLQIFPFKFDIDRYKLGVLGYTDIDLNFRYHISVLKSPIPFKFGINIYGTPDKMHFRFGGAKFKDTAQYISKNIVESAQINLRQQIRQSFRKGARAAMRNEVQIKERPAFDQKLNRVEQEVMTHEDSVELINNGFIEAPPAPPVQDAATVNAASPAGSAPVAPPAPEGILNRKQPLIPIKQQ